MKKYKQVAICLAACMSFCSVCNFPAMQLPVNAAVDTEITGGVTSVVPWSSDVFRSCYGKIYSGSIQCYAELSGVGTGTIRTILQKQDANGNWYDYNTSDPGQTYRGVSSVTHKYYCSMPSGGTYRCRFVATGTVNGVSSPRSGYSGVYYA